MTTNEMWGVEMKKGTLCGGLLLLGLAGCGGDSSDSAITASNATANVYTATGLLDTPDFNTVGYTTFDVAGSHDSGEAAVIVADGSIYVTGYANNGANYDIALWRLLADGTFDTSFDTDGLVVLNSAAGGNGHDFGKDVAIDANGKVVVVGHSRTAAGDYDLTVARFNTDGTLDTTFGGDVNPVDGTPDGFTVIDVSGAGSAEEGAELVIDSSGNLYVSGNTDAAGTNDLTLWRFTSSGALDTSFAGGAGYLSYDSGGDDRGHGLTMDGSGKLLVTGAAGGMAVWRVTATGVSDTAFNGTGVAVDTGGTGKAIAVDASGRIVVTGDMVVTGNRNDMALWRYTSAGVLDTTFGGDYDSNGTPDGYVTHDGAGLISTNDFDYGMDLAIDGAGNLLVAGSSMASHAGVVKADTAVWRYTDRGVLDTTFGDDMNPADSTPDGFFTHHGASGGNNLDQGKALVIDSQGFVLVAGESVNATGNSDLAVWRLY